MTLCTSAIEGIRHQMAKMGFFYLLFSLFCILFGAVYEHFSHEVYSSCMIYAFLFPLIGGVLPFYGFSLFGHHSPGRLPLHLYHSGIAALTVGSIFQGVLEIYGTTNRLTAVYWIVGIALSAIGIAGCLISLFRKKNISHS